MSAIFVTFTLAKIILRNSRTLFLDLIRQFLEKIVQGLQWGWKKIGDYQKSFFIDPRGGSFVLMKILFSWFWWRLNGLERVSRVCNRRAKFKSKQVKDALHYTPSWIHVKNETKCLFFVFSKLVFRIFLECSCVSENVVFEKNSRIL